MAKTRFMKLINIFVWILDFRLSTLENPAVTSVKFNYTKFVSFTHVALRLLRCVPILVTLLRVFKCTLDF